MKRAISTISRPYSLYASASCGGPAPDLAHGLGVIVGAPQVVIVEGRERAVKGQDAQAVAGEVRSRMISGRSRLTT